MLLTHISHDEETKSGLYYVLCQYDDITKIWITSLYNYNEGKNILLKSRTTNDKKKALNTYYYYKKLIRG